MYRFSLPVMKMIDSIEAWQAVAARDRAADGRFVFGVTSTGVYCRPSCPARRPAPANIRFYEDGAAARAEGFRACLRCRPDHVRNDLRAVARAVRLIEESEMPPTLNDMAREAALSPHHFHRLFRRETGVTPAAYARAVRARRAEAALAGGDSVTGAIYQAGYSAASRFYEEGRGGMKPARRAKGGVGEVIRHAVVDSPLGPLLVAATDKGLCRISFDEDETALATRFPAARIEPADAALAALIGQVIGMIKGDLPAADLPLDVRGTAFQERIWQELTRIPPGETRSYAALAAAAGAPNAVRAAGSACGANPVSIVVPCHRVLRGDGSLGGYAWGLDRKQALLDVEAAMAAGRGPSATRRGGAR